MVSVSLNFFRMVGKFTPVLLVLITAYNAPHAQPDIQWENNFGGSEDDEAHDIEQTADGGFVVTGYSESSDGDVGGNNGSDDYWVVKLDATGQLQWETNLGGSSNEWAEDIVQTADGGFVVAGYSLSNDGDVGGNYGGEDYWVVKLDATGQLQWETNLGGSSKDWAEDIEQTADGGFVVAGHSESNDGDVGGNNGRSDYWVVKLDETGQLQWENNLGGSNRDEAEDIEKTADGGFVVAGYSLSNDGDVGGNYGVFDYWVMKLDATGQLQWETNLGGSGPDRAYDIEQTAYGGFVIAGRSYFTRGNFTGMDYWVVKLDATGQLQWETNLGGRGNDYVYGIEQTVDGGFVVAGWSISSDGDVGGNKGGEDYWVVKLERNLNVELGPDTTICKEDSLVLSVNVFQGDSLVWNTGDTTEQIVVREPGVYHATIRANGTVASDTIEVSQAPRPQVDIGPDQQVFCSQVDTTLVSETKNAETYRWNTGDTTKNLYVNEEGQYRLRVESEESCSNADTIHIEQIINLPAKLDSNEVNLCGQQATLDAGNPEATYQWNTGSTDQTITVNSDGLYWVEISNDTCSIRDSVEVTLAPRPKVYIGPSQQAFCGQIDTTLVPETKKAQTYRWNTGDTTKTLYVDEEGQYWLRVESKESCPNADTTELQEIAYPESFDSSEITACQERVELDAGNPGASYHWNTGDTSQILTVKTDGRYAVEIANAYCAIKDTVQVKVDEEAACPKLFVPNAFSPNGDGLNEAFKPEGQKILDYEMTIYNRWGQRIFHSEAMDKGWDGTIKGQQAPSGAYMYQIVYKLRNDEGIVRLKTKEGTVQLMR